MSIYRDQTKKRIERLVQTTLDESLLFPYGTTALHYNITISEEIGPSNHGTSSNWNEEDERQTNQDISSKNQSDLMATHSKFHRVTSFLSMDKADQGFRNIIACFMEVSSTNMCLSQLIQSLLNWRLSVMETNISTPHETTLKPKRKTDQAKLQHNEEKQQLAVDFIFACTVLSLLEHSLRHDNLEDSISTQLETLAMENFRPYTRPEKTIFWERRSPMVVDAGILNENRKQIGELFCNMISVLSQHRLKQISTHFFNELNPLLSGGGSSFIHGNSANTAKAISTIHGIRFLKLKIRPKQHLERSMEFVSLFNTLISKASKSEVKQEAIDVLGNILDLLVADILGNSEKENSISDIPEWHSLMRKTFENTEPKRSRKSTKDMSSYPLMVCSLCLSDREYFLNNYPSILTDHLIKNLHKLKAVGIDLIRQLLEMHLVKYPDVPFDERLTFVTQHLFPKKFTGTFLVQGDCADALVDIICTFSRFRLDFVMKHIMTELLRPDVISPERMIIGLRALLILSSESKLTVHEKSTLNPNRSYRKSTLLRRHAIGVELEPYLPQINSSISYILTTLDSTYGSLLLQNQTKTLAELIPKTAYGTAGVELLRRCMNCIPFAFPIKLTCYEMVTLLSKYLNHMDESLRLAASDVLDRLMKIPSTLLRCTVIYALANHIVTIPDQKSALVMPLLSKIESLLEMWSLGSLFQDHALVTNLINTSSINLGSEADAYKSTLKTRVEGLVLLFFCCPLLRIRKLSLEILRYIRIISKRFLSEEEDDIDLVDLEGILSNHAPTISVMDVMDESGMDVIELLRQEGHLSNANDTVFSLICNQEANSNGGRLMYPAAVSSANLSYLTIGTAEGQAAWTFCLGELVKLWLRFCPAAVQICFDSIHSKLITSASEEGMRISSVPSTEPEFFPVWWRNYIVFATSAATKRFTSSSVSVSNLPNLKDIFNHVVPFLKSPIESQAQNALLALERTNPLVLDVLFDIMKPLEQEYIKKGKTKRKDRYRLRILVSFLYNSIVCRMKAGTLSDADVKRHLVSYIQETISFLSSSEHDFLVDNLRNVRLNFCSLIDGLSRQQLEGKEEVLDKNLRRDIFIMMREWSQGPSILAEEQGKKRLNAFLAQLKEVERKGYEKIISEYLSSLQQSSCNAMAALLSGSSWETTDNGSKIFQWINNLLTHKSNEQLRRIARTALYSYAKGNLENTDLLDNIIDQCYSSESLISIGYFMVLTELFEEYELKYPYHILMNLILYKSGDRSHAVRRSAIKALRLLNPSEEEKKIVVPETFAEELLANQSSDEQFYQYPQHFISTTQEIYLDAQHLLSQKLADECGSLCYLMLDEISRRLENVNEESRRQMLDYILPWIQKINFSELALQQHILQVAEKLLILAIKYADVFSFQIEAIWQCLGEKDTNIQHIIKYLMDITIAKQNIAVIGLFKRIVLYFARKSPQVLIDSIVSELSSPSAGRDLGVSGSSFNVNYGDRFGSNRKENIDVNSNSLSSLLGGASGAGIKQPVARGHLALILLAELSYEIGHPFIPHLHIVLHLAFLNIDNHLPTVYEHSRILLLNLVHSLAIQNSDPKENEHYEEAVSLRDYLKAKENRQVWTYEHTTLERWNTTTAKELANIVGKTNLVLSSQNKTLTSLWAQHALLWAINCPSSHLSCRSHQVYRQLKHQPRREDVIDLVRALFKSLNGPSNDNQGLVLEILFTLQSIVEILPNNKILLLAQIFWSATCLLYSNYSLHYCQSIEILCRIIAKIDFSDHSAQNIFKASIPRWTDEHDVQFVGLQPLLLRGLMKPETEAYSVKILSQIATLPCDDIFHPQSSRFITNVVGLLPYLCYNIKQGSVHHADSVAISRTLSHSSIQHGYHNLNAVFLRYEHIRDIGGFLSNICIPIRDVAKPNHNYLLFSILFHMLEHGQSIYQGIILQIIRSFFAVSLPECLQNEPNLRDQISTWLNMASRFIDSAECGTEAVQLIHCALQQVDPAMRIDSIQSKPIRPSEFSNMDNSFVCRALSKVLEICKREKENSIQPEITPAFWEGFFSEQLGYEDQQLSESENSTMRFGTMVFGGTMRGRFDSFSDPSSEEPEEYDEEKLSIKSIPNSNLATASQENSKPSKFQQPVGQLGAFPTFSFDDIFNFGDEESDDD
eukprot:TRINITY_DN5056_c0_g1_i2.p1 TRINITY_DN5056_c0_g1~~TRINITY_DN5056_c0_g1_i2.p1  ORF type:complete len:2145 (+),score=361.36 TRINITY_DN5056_c0_g1_i2:746-7180(+)